MRFEGQNIQNFKKYCQQKGQTKRKIKQNKTQWCTIEKKGDLDFKKGPKKIIKHQNGVVISKYNKEKII